MHTPWAEKASQFRWTAAGKSLQALPALRGWLVPGPLLHSNSGSGTRGLVNKSLEQWPRGKGLDAGARGLHREDAAAKAAGSWVPPLVLEMGMRKQDLCSGFFHPQRHPECGPRLTCCLRASSS